MTSEPRLRTATPGDAEAVAAIYAPYVRDTAVSFEVDPPSVDEMHERIAGILQRFPWLVSLDAAGQVSGYVYAARHRERAAYRWAVETTVYIRPDSHGRGLGRRLYAALFAELAELGYAQALAGITLPNAGSVALHEVVGFEPIGVYRDVGFKLGRWRDIGWWQKALRPLPEAPEEPRPFGAR
jgi:L-amino acid N-acyltransferase YncA